MSSWPPKDPNEVLDYQIDWADPVRGPRLVVGETLISSTFTITAGDVIINNSSFTAAGVTTVWLSGGSLGGINTITNRVVTSAARTYEKAVKLRIRNP